MVVFVIVVVVFFFYYFFYVSDSCSWSEGELLGFVKLSETLARFRWVEWFPFERSRWSGARLERFLSITGRSLSICGRRLLVLPFGAISCHMSLFFAIEASSLGLKASLVFFCIGASDIGVYWWVYIHRYSSVIGVHVVPVSIGSFG